MKSADKIIVHGCSKGLQNKRRMNMGLLLHISDLHFGRNKQEEANRIRDLANTIISQGLNIKHVIFTGDVIDARVVIVLTLKKLADEFPGVFSKIDMSKFSVVVDEALKLVESSDLKIIERYNEYLKEIAIDCAQSADDIVNDFLKSVNVKRILFHVVEIMIY